MARNPARPRFEWLPGAAAIEALEIAERLMPNLGRQEILDRLVLVGLSALKHRPWVPPALFGNDRDAWRLPTDLRIVDTPRPDSNPPDAPSRG